MIISYDRKEACGTNLRGVWRELLHPFDLGQRAFPKYCPRRGWRETNEVMCVLKLLDSLALEVGIIMIEAVGAQVGIVGQIVKEKAESILVLEANL